MESQETFFSPNTGAAHSGDGFRGLGYTRYQQLKEVLQHGVDHALISDVYREIKVRLRSVGGQRKGPNGKRGKAEHEQHRNIKKIEH